MILQKLPIFGNRGLSAAARGKIWPKSRVTAGDYNFDRRPLIEIREFYLDQSSQASESVHFIVQTSKVSYHEIWRKFGVKFEFVRKLRLFFGARSCRYVTTNDANFFVFFLSVFNPEANRNVWVKLEMVSCFQISHTYSLHYKLTVGEWMLIVSYLNMYQLFRLANLQR